VIFSESSKCTVKQRCNDKDITRTVYIRITQELMWLVDILRVNFINGRCSFIHSVFCLTTGPKPPPKRFLQIVRSRTSSFKWEYPLLSLRSSNSFIRLLPRLLVTSIPPFIFPSITCFRRQFLRKMWPIQLAFCLLVRYKTGIISIQFNMTAKGRQTHAHLPANITKCRTIPWLDCFQCWKCCRLV